MNIKNIIFLGIGVVIGGGIAYKLTSEAAKKMLNEEIESMQDYYECKMAEMEETATVTDIAEEIEADISDKLKKAANKPPIEEMMAKAEENGYIDYSTKAPANERRKKRGEEIEEVLNKLPKVISPAEYAMSDEDITNVGYEWYDRNDTLVNEEGEVIDPKETIGIWPPEYFDRIPDDPDTIYMRNETLKIDIEIIRVDGEYEAE